MLRAFYFSSILILLFFAVSCGRTTTPTTPPAQAPSALPAPQLSHEHAKPPRDGHQGHVAHAAKTQHDRQGHHNQHAQDPGHQDHHPAQAHTKQQSAQQHKKQNAHAADKTPPAKPVQGESSLAIFEKRILPIFQATKPSSCAECHLSGVDLKDYIRGTQQETFASLVGAGMIDLDKPEDSKILRFINRRPEKTSTEEPNLVTDKVRREEYEAFRAWIQAAVSDPNLLAAKSKSRPIGPELPDEVIRHARRDRVLASFIDNIWTEVGRCAACHSPDRNQDKVKKHGEQVSWIKLGDPQGTLEYMVEAGLIDPDEPTKSLLLAKPTMQVDHGGGQKMVVGDRSYKQFRRFIDDYAAMAKGQYKTAAQLPKPSDEFSVVTEIWLKITDVPAKYDKMLLQVDLYRWTDGAWSKARVATSDRPVFGKGQLWQHSLSLTAPRGPKAAEELRAQRLPPGRYLAKVYIDQRGKLAKDYRAELAQDDLVAEIEVESRWPAGYGEMTVVKFPAK